MGLLVANADGVVVVAEGAAFSHLGLPAQRLVGQQLSDPAAVPRWWVAAARTALEGREAASLGRSDDGQLFELVLRPARDPDGEVGWVVGSLHELSEAAARAEELHTARVRRELEELAELTDGVFWEADPESLRFEHVSERAETMLGFSAKSWRRPGFWRERLHPEDREETVATCERAVREGRPHQLEYRMIHASGRPVWVRDFVGVGLEDGRVERLRGVMVDITQRRRAEEEREAALQEAQRARGAAEADARRSRFLADASRKVSASLDFQATLAAIAEVAIPNFAEAAAAFLFENGRFEKLAAAHQDPGISRLLDESFARFPPDPEARVGMGSVARTQRSFLLPEVTDAFLQKLARAPEHLELLRRMKMKSYLSVPLVGVDGAVGVLAFATQHRTFDESDLELAEELGRRCGRAMEHARLHEQTRRAIALRDDFLAIASHELRTPLTPLKLVLDALETRLSPSDLAPRRLVRRAERSVERLTELVSDLLDVTQLEAGSLTLHTERFALDAPIRSLVEDFSEGRRRHRFDVSGIRPGVVVDADRGRILQVVSNLLDNACKYSPEGGTVRVLVHEVDGWARISVADEGVGVPVEERTRIFERFFRARSSPSSRFGGLGLGLYICRSIVERHRGRIWVEGNGDGEGQGSVFHVLLPLAHGCAAVAQ